MAVLPLFVHSSSTKQTDDTDSGRYNDYPSIITDKNGRSMMFYQKKLNSGRLSDGGITFTSPSFDCSIPAGNGEINGNPVSWGATVLTLPADSYVLIYVNVSGVVGATSDFPMTFTKDVIILAHAYIGLGTIVRILEVEQNGYYIFHRKQVLSGSSYVWDDYEYKLNVGIKPEAFYDADNDKIYLSFQKDAGSFVRMFDLTIPETWQDLNHILIVGDNIYPVPYPHTGLEQTSAVSNGRWREEGLLFDFANDIAVGLEIGTNIPYIHVPEVASNFQQYMINPGIMNTYSKSGSVYTFLEAFNNYNYNRYPGLVQLWGHSRGYKYAGLDINHRLYVGNYITDQENYREFFIPDNIDLTTDVDATNRRTKIYPEVWSMHASYSKASLVKTVEWVQSYGYADDLLNDLESACSKAVLTKDLEFEQIYDFSDTDSLTDLESACSKAESSIVNV